MRRTISAVAMAAALCTAAWAAQQLPGQPPPQAPPPHPHHSRSPLAELLHPSRPQPLVEGNSGTPADTTFDATRLGSPEQLDKDWRVGITGDPAAANPDFDDSSWPVREGQEMVTDVPDVDHAKGGPGHGHGDHGADRDSGDGGLHMQVNGQEIDVHHGQRFAWFRMHIKLAPGHGALAFYLELPVSKNASIGGGSSGPVVDVYANGKEITPEGPHAGDLQRYQQISRIYKLDVPADQTSLVLALRTPPIHVGAGIYTGFFTRHNLRLGYQDDLDRMLELWSNHSLFERLPRLVISILLLVLAAFLLALYFSQRGHPEYLWLALHELTQAPIGFVDLAGSSARMDQLWYAATIMELVLLSAYLYFEFLISFLSLRRRWFTQLLRYGAPFTFLVGPAILYVEHGRAIEIALVAIMAVCFLWVVGWAIIVFITLILATLRRNFEAGLLLIPLVLSIIGVLEPVLTAGMSNFGNASYQSPLTLEAGPIPIHFASIADFAGLFVIVLIIFVRFLRIQRNQERASSELAAARSVQELMIPQEKLETPGFEVDSIYNPANEVGGDFFHVQTTKDGGLLVVIGDVAGKGLKAAMSVSMLMGGLRRTPERSPARILESLNRVLAGSDSFTTCQAAYFGANGELVLANAGHLPPYLNSQELVLPGGLPLGVLADNSYEEVRLYLHPGDRILLISDGVVEARGDSGELFGFERVHNLSNQTAFYIADAAKAFGQEDDITVLTVRRMTEAMAA